MAQKKKTGGPIQKKPKTSASSHSAAVPEGPAPPDAHVVQYVVHVTPEGRYYIKIGEDYFAADSMSSTIPGPKLGTLETGAAKH